MTIQVKPPAFKFNSGKQKIVEKKVTEHSIAEDNDSSLLKAE